MSRWMIDRRTFLRGTGAAVSLPLLDIMGNRSFAAESTNQAPQRLVSIFQPNGVYPKAWDVTGIGSSFEFSPILSPLKHLKDNWPIVMAGRGAGVITPGRQLQINNPTPLANLLFSISQGFGVEGDNFNGVSTGFISELTV